MSRQILKEKAQEQREAFTSSSSIRREEDSKMRTKRESPKRIPKEAPARKKSVNCRRSNEARKKMSNSKDTSSRGSTSCNKSRPRDKEESGAEEHLRDRQEDPDHEHGEIEIVAERVVRVQGD